MTCWCDLDLDQHSVAEPLSRHESLNLKAVPVRTVLYTVVRNTCGSGRHLCVPTLGSLYLICKCAPNRKASLHKHNIVLYVAMSSKINLKKHGWFGLFVCIKEAIKLACSCQMCRAVKKCVRLGGRVREGHTQYMPQCEMRGGTGQTVVAEGKQIERRVNSGLEHLLAQQMGLFDAALGLGKVHDSTGHYERASSIYDRLFSPNELKHHTPHKRAPPFCSVPTFSCHPLCGFHYKVPQTGFLPLLSSTLSGGSPCFCGHLPLSLYWYNFCKTTTFPLVKQCRVSLKKKKKILVGKKGLYACKD